MSAAVAHRASRRLAAWALAGSMLAVAPLACRAADDAREWLQKMTHALAARNYDGTFFHLSQGRVETMRILHRVRGDQVTERLLSLDGSGREFVRTNDQLTCYLPDQRTVLVEPRQTHGPFLGSLPQFGPGVAEYYRIESLPRTRLLGRSTRVIAVTPKDEYRFGYRLWLDEATAMPLKTQLCDPRGQVIEQILFARLTMRDSITDAELAPATRTDGMRWVRQAPADDAAGSPLAAFRASDLPPGFRLTLAGSQKLKDAGEPASHLVYSDGLATVSVFVEDGAAARSAAPSSGAAAGGTTASGTAASSAAPSGATGEGAPDGLARVGSGFAYSTVVQGHQVTAVGEVPARTVESIANSVRAVKDLSPAHRP